MQFSTVLALAASVLSVQADMHSHLHQRAHARDLAKRAGVVNLNAAISVLAAVNNADAAAGQVSSMPYTQTIINNATSDAAYTCWNTKDFSIVYNPYNLNPPTPLVVVDIPAGETRYVSFSDSFSGACAPVYKDTALGPASNIAEAWIELTTGPFATVDVSYQPNTKARWTSVEVDGCISDKKMCSFSCVEGLDHCVNKEDVTFENCTNDSESKFFQEKASFGTLYGALEGGCNIVGTKKFIVTLNSNN